MKKQTAFLSAIFLGALVAIACQSGSDSSTSPSATVASQDGGSGAKVFATPSSSPVGPSGPTGPIGPGPVPVPVPGPAPAPGPVSSPSGPNPGGPGSTPTPTPATTPTPGTTPTAGTSPTPGGSPTPTPPLLPCPPTFDYTTSTPVNMDGLELRVPTGNFVDACYVDRMIVTLHAKTTDSSNFLGPGASVGAEWQVCGSGATTGGEFGGCSGANILTMTHLSPPSGNQIGNACGSLIFDDTASTAFNPPGNPGAPFTGTFKPEGVLPRGWRLSSEFTFLSYASIGDLELRCLTVTFVTRSTPPSP